MRKVQFTAVARQQFLHSRRWYEGRRPGLGREFADEVDAYAQRIARHPEQFKFAQDNDRRVPLVRFPYELFYDFDEVAVTIYAVFHTAQDPAIWQRMPPN